MGTIYTTDKITEIVRKKLDDQKLPYLVDDDTLATYIDEVQRDFCERTLALTDFTNYPITLVADHAMYAVDSRILKVRSGYLTTGKSLVTPVTLNEIAGLYRELDYGVSFTSWRTATGKPVYMITDAEVGYVRMVPIPVAVDTVELSTYLWPAPVTDVGDTLTLADDKAQDLIPGILALAYGDQDAEIYDPEQEKRWDAKWERRIRYRMGKIERNTRGPGSMQFSKNGVW